MPELREDGEIYPLLIDLLACAETELERSGLPPTISAIVPGQLAINDYAGDGKNCDEMVVNVVQAYPYQDFPTPSDQASCTSPLAYEVQLTIFRCAANPTGTRQAPKPPTPAAQLESVRGHLADMQAMRRAIRCCMQNGERLYALRLFTPIGPTGGVIGGTWSFLVGGDS